MYREQKDPFQEHRKWNTDKILAEKGILVACDITQEWILPWWWDHYQKTNQYPVCFIDLGMSKPKKSWCQERGIYRALRTPDPFVAEKSEVNSDRIQDWEGHYGKSFWLNRNAWFKKPLACLLTAFEKTIWLDIDCKVQGSLEPLFSLSDTSAGFSIAKENRSVGDCPIFNSGVMVFKRMLPLIEEWANLAYFENHAYAGDQDVLSFLIKERKIAFHELPQTYNWSRCNRENPQAQILHLHGLYGKTVIAHEIMRSTLESR